MKRILKTFLNRLTNLTGNNRSILLLRLTAEQFIDVHEFDFQFKEPSFSIVEDLIAKKQQIKLAEAINSRDAKANELSNKLKKLHRRDKFITDERGAKDLYVGWPFVKGKLMDGSNVRAPLLFFPVELSFENHLWSLSLRKEENVALNKSFLLAYAHFNKVALTEDFIEKQFEEWSKNSQVFRTELYTLLKESALTINFNQDLFIDKLSPFHNYKKEEFENTYKTGELKLFPEAVLGIFPQAGSYLEPDYNQLLEQNQYKDLEDLFLEKTPANNSDNTDITGRLDYLNRVKEENTFTPFSIDASQENAIKAVKSGNSLVVQGPPGSGKSQLICNLIADYIARGKRVLMVCQKRVALDVVHQRLKDDGLGEFISLVHDFKNDRKSIYNQLNGQIERLKEYQNKNNSLDAIYLERSFLQASRKIDQLTEELEEFKRRLFDTSDCGVSVKELYLRSDRNKPFVELNEEYKSFPFHDIEDFISRINYYFNYSEKFEQKKYEWKDRLSFAGFAISDLSQINKALKEIPEYLQALPEKTLALTGKKLIFYNIEKLVTHKQRFIDFIEAAQEPQIFSTFQEIFNESAEQVFWLERIEKRVMQCFEGDGPETILQKHRLGQFQEALINAEEAAESSISWFRWRLFSKDRVLVKRILQENNLKVNKAGIETLTKKLDNRLNLEHNLTELHEKKWLNNYPQIHYKLEYQSWFYRYKKALRLKEKYGKISAFIGLDMQSISLGKLKERLEELMIVADETVAKKQEWMKYISQSQIDKIIADPSFAYRLSTVLGNDFDGLCEYDSTYRDFSSHQRSVVDKVLAVGEDLSATERVELFLNSLRLAWIEHIENLYPILRSASTLKLRQQEAELQQKVNEKGSLSKEILLLKLRERTYKEIEVNRLKNIVTYRDLAHQVTKKRMIWPLRKLMATHSDEIFNLVPCWLASPESVSAIFPLEPYFDLVIFDEASQCFAENGIPAIYRGKQIVITGDNKQLTPNDIYKSRWEEEDEEIPDVQIDSLLDLGARYLMQTQLTGHYRSRTLELIDFSNHHFYNGKLSLLPHFTDLNTSESSIEYIKVDGIWHQNINETEAIKVKETVFSLLESGMTNIGVVTFNYAQQNLIQNLLEAEAALQDYPLPSSVFVKNIENVQGDERDVIIFSTGYAPDEKGRLAMNFGTLNTQGGENRLNVAITRAKRKIIIITSISPEQLRVDESRHEGPKLFKKYLQYALDVSRGRHQLLDDGGKEQLPFTQYLKHHLRELLSDGGDSLTINGLPFSDLSLKREENYKGLILTDDDLYYSSLSVKDSHVYKKLTLASKGWKFRDFYSREFWSNREGLKQDYLKFKGEENK